MEQKKNTEEIFQKLLKSECTPEEISQLLESLNTAEKPLIEELIYQQLQNPAEVSELTFQEAARLNDGLRAILTQSETSIRTSSLSSTSENKRRNSFALLRYAAAVLVIVLGGSWWYYSAPIASKKNSGFITKTLTGEKPEDFIAGGNKAILVTSDGRAIDLEEKTDKKIVDGIAVIHPSEGSIIYNQPEGLVLRQTEPLYHTLIIPRGGKYQITLSDGTKVWLNAASTLRFPEVFHGQERIVELTGEGYFEVAKNADMPFRVKINDVTVNVSGTHFNVNGYPENEGVKTTLLEGAVTVTTPLGHASLSPGEQVSYRNKQLGRKVKGINTDQVIAWKDNNFDFTNETLSRIASQLSRWYQVDITVDESIASRHMSGIISRENNISKVLEVIGFSAEISYKFQDNKIYLYKK